MAEIHDRLLAWYAENGRDLPWRRTKDPYPVWVSEVMLQQTQVATALPFYHRWMTSFPTVETLAVAEEQEVLAAWQGLGYYRRARALHLGAKVIADRGWPSDLDGWRQMPGVGRYTAGAICSICLGLPEPVVDGNVARVFARLTATESSGAKLINSAWKWAEANVHPDAAALWNQALMELGATVCKPTKPQCSLCPIAIRCVARQTGREAELPIKETARKPVHLVRSAFVHWSNGKFGIRKIDDGQWWEGMWEFPWVEGVPNLNGYWAESLGVFRHQVTHHRLAIEALLVRTESETELEWRTPAEMELLPLPAPQRRIFEAALKHVG